MVNAARAALALSLLVTAVSEITGVYERSSGRFWTEGLGYRLFRSLDEGRDDRLYAAIVVFALLGTIADKLLLGVHYLGVNFRTAYLRAVARRRARVSLEPFHMASHPAMLEVLGLTVGYSDRIVFEGMSMSIQAGETVAWIAPSGGGKSTGLVALAGLHSDDLWVRGQVLVDSQKPYSNWYGLVLQDAPVFEHLTVLDHVMIGDRISRLEMPTRINTSLSILEQFGLAKSVTQLARELSGGQRQRLALATSIANNPSVLLADEPWSAVDAFTRESLYDFLSRKIIGRTTMLLVTHDVQEAARLATRVYVGVGEDRAEIVFDEFTSDPSSAEWDAELHRRVTLLRNALRNTFA